MKQIVTILLFCVTMVSCEQKQKKSEVPDNRTLTAARNSFFAYLQDPNEVAGNLVPGIGFDASLLHNPKNFYQYIGNDVKAAANFGVYIADLNYCLINKQSEKGKEYFEAAHELSKILLVEKRTLEFLMNRYKENIEKNDSVKIVMEQLLAKSTRDLKGTDRERLAGIAMAAYQVENLHLVLSTLQSFPEKLDENQIQTKNYLLNFILDQRQKIVLIHSFIRENSDPMDPDRNPNYPFYDNALRELIDVYQQVTMDDPKLKELTEKNSEIRNKIIRIE